jgi:predicted NUDIX family phosphoesterase/dephospho-CoA kinase
MEQRPLHPREITDIAFRKKLFSDTIAGKTPYQTMKSKLSQHIRKYGARSPFIRTSPGKFFLSDLLSQNNSGIYKPYVSRPFKKPDSKESVLAFRGDWLNRFGRFQGVSRNWRSILKHLPNVATYVPRMWAETNNEHKQIINYIMVTRGQSVLTYRRGTYNRVEDSLKGAQCIGFGGHVTAVDLQLFVDDSVGITQGAIRELGEELKLPKKDQHRLYEGEGPQLIGVLNDDSSEAGLRHFAFLFKYEVSDDPAWEVPQRNERAITQLQWLNPGDGAIPIQRFEYWSQLCLREYFNKSIAVSPSYKIVNRARLKRPNLLCVLGTVGSGKSEATRILCNDFGYKEVNSGKVLARLLGIPPVPDTPRETFQAAAWSFITSHDGPVSLAAEIYKEASADSTSSYLVDGIRQLSTLDALRSMHNRKPFAVMYIHTPADLAYTFYKERERANLSALEFFAIRNAPVERDVESMIASSDVVLYNWKGKDRFIRVIRKLMREIET